MQILKLVPGARSAQCLLCCVVAEVWEKRGTQDFVLRRCLGLLNFLFSSPFLFSFLFLFSQKNFCKKYHERSSSFQEHLILGSFWKLQRKVECSEPNFSILWNENFPTTFILPVIKDLFHGPFGKYSYFFPPIQIQNKTHISIKPQYFLSSVLSVLRPPRFPARHLLGQHQAWIEPAMQQLMW